MKGRGVRQRKGKEKEEKMERARDRDVKKVEGDRRTEKTKTDIQHGQRHRGERGG